MFKIALKIIIILCIVMHTRAQEKKTNTETLIRENIERLTKNQSYYYDKGEYERFKLYTDSILHIAKKNNLQEIEIDAITRLGIYHKKKAEYDKALLYYLESLKLVNLIPESYKRRTVILINLGNTYNEIGNREKAKKAFKEALDYVNNHGGPSIYRMAIYVGLGELSAANNNYKKSLEYFEKSKKIGEELKRNDIIISALNSIADNYYQLKKYELSLKNSQDALALNDNNISKELIASTHYNIGSALIKLNRLEDAEQPLQIALGLAFTYEYRKTEMYVHQKLAYIYTKLGKLEKAINHQKGYDHKKGLYLSSLSEAKQLELEIELKKLEEDLAGLSEEKNFFIISGIIVFLLLSGVLFYYLKKSRKFKQETRELKEDRMLLKNENETLKIKIYKLAQQNISSLVQKNTNTHAYQNSSLTQEDREKYLQKILDYMEKEKPYLNFEIKQSDLAKELSMSVHQFSEVLNVCLKKNFNNFINLYRINEAKSLMKKNKYENYKILAIAYDAGFNSKTSFNRAFKQLVGKTPSEYREKSLKDLTL
ncbi:AraC family transcriptional regulator [Aquimarina algiphila]|uniref:AraC family transcriptional regulator n=1 Tax=Aquimarina algiphila TaxID=2047982 RepID=UPI00248FD6B4|nr:AraC family transcriptional regulator [Aquimarina algiphila]